MPSTLNWIYGSTVVIIGFLSAAILAVPLALLEPLRYLGAAPHAVLICLRDILVELAWKPMMVVVWAANVRICVSRPDSYRFPGEGGWLPDRDKSRKFVVNANHQNLGDTLLISYLLNALNATNGSGMWTIWESFKSLPLLWGSWMAGHMWLSKRTIQGEFDFSSFQRDNFSHLLVYTEGGCRDQESKIKAEEYADKQGLTRPRHTLLPRAGLLHMVLPDLKKAGAKELVDLTIAYPPGCDALASKWNLLEFGCRNEQPYNVHIHVRTIPLTSLGTSLEEVQESLYKIYREKDALLERCATEGCFPNEQPLAVPIRWWGLQVFAWVVLLWYMFFFFARTVGAFFMASGQVQALIALILSAAVATWWNKEMLRLPAKSKQYFAAAALAALALSAAACSFPDR